MKILGVDFKGLVDRFPSEADMLTHFLFREVWISHGDGVDQVLVPIGRCGKTLRGIDPVQL
jgi:hypothetical protein